MGGNTPTLCLDRWVEETDRLARKMAADLLNQHDFAACVYSWNCASSRAGQPWRNIVYRVMEQRRLTHDLFSYAFLV